MKTWIALIVSLLSLSAQADVISTRVFRLQAPSAPGMDAEVLSTRDGRVYYVAESESTLLSQLAELAENRAPARLVLDGDRVVAAAPLSPNEAAAYGDDLSDPSATAQAEEALAPPSASESGPGSVLMPQSLVAARALGYQPTILSSVADAQILFRSERELNHHSQCFERAQVWTREFEAYHGVRSMKVFMFFTERFRQRYTHRVLFSNRPYKWWFHVAPMVYVGMSEYVLDREFLNQAVTLEDWTFNFIGQVEHDNREIPNPTRGEALCLDAQTYAQYADDGNPARYCVLRKVPMYYFEPRDVEALDCKPGQGTQCARSVVSSWRQGELNLAYHDTKK